MESQQTAPHRHHAHHHDPHNVALHRSVEGEEDGQHHEKKSVLKKVKAKAKKIKDTITKHGHGHDHHEPEDHEEEEGGGAVVDPELQGAPLYEGAAMRSAMAGKGQQQDVGIGLPTEVHDQPPPAPRETASRPSAVEPNTTMSLSPWRLEEGPQAPKDKAPYPHTPHNSEVKALDPTKRGNEETGDSQTFDSFARMKLNNEDVQTRPGLASGIDEGNQRSSGEKISGVGSSMRSKAEENTDTNSSSPLEYGRKIALAVTEKLKPGEEDKALSEVISEAYNTSKEKVVKAGENQPKGKVTESEELTQRLGREDNNEGTQRYSPATSTTAATVKNMADMVRDSVGSWMGKGGDPNTS
ncbi:low-temperature-induced 65 kDa protein-like [Cucurbita pepo subsp. pepo]|uniref:low-temperature-induced 65 kDa protein-like n=1 Tax=Cucurbita pepo subsp. pepo TaxID=3664 RepID=UPI000C9D3CAA|nr:low-temperature-induced 65 kDa protein-like [Cucurbita pepo subsp. pepo]XP_023532941.1 low-temperature-induced 65 kDa protein-like [Cucurbita pepo subsp. pepo]